MVIYESIEKYLETCSTLRDRITAIDAVIEALLLTAAKAAATDNITEYWLNDGQTMIKTMYKGTDKIYASIKSFETLRNYYQIKLNGGRMTRLVDSKNFTGNGSFR